MPLPKTEMKINLTYRHGSIEFIQSKRLLKYLRCVKQELEDEKPKL